MTTIKVTPDHLQDVSKQFFNAQLVVENMNAHLISQMSFMVANWEGTTKHRFYEEFQTAKRNMENFVLLTGSISQRLKEHAEKFRQADESQNGSMDSSCLPPPPNSCAAPASDTITALEKSGDSLKQLGSDIKSGFDERYAKKFDSFWAFLDFASAGIPKGAYQAYVERANNMFDSPNDFLNGMTFGVHGTIREAIFPTNAWSTEHMANIIGTVGLVSGGMTTKAIIKPKTVVESSVKFEGGSELRQISSDGLRNELPLIEIQQKELMDYTKSLGFPEENIIISKPGFYDEWNTGMMYDRFIINTDVLPAESTGIGTLTANSRVTGRATVAHEIVGHYEAYQAGRAFELYGLDADAFKMNFALDEAQASIRAARFAPELTSTERITLLRDAITRLHHGGLKWRDVKDKLYIDER
ncbi:MULTISPECIES: WXG100 family type VII secretion target [Paenibacillus]|uniref:WXG100 family type VII secretion target n=1 Tax=Paenibacillus TaxID=44249 RepID=UPI00119D3D2E|nr:WXG100 family type VII secretion target [Paenibacillus sp. IHBB 10380]